MMKLALNKPGVMPVTADDLEKYKEERQGLEVDLLDEILGSRQRAWKVAGWAIGVGLFGMALAGFVVWRYSQPVPGGFPPAESGHLLRRSVGQLLAWTIHHSPRRL